MDVDVERLQSALLSEVAAAPDLQALEQLRVGALGKKGRITGLTKSLGGLDPEARRAAGQRYNQLKDAVSEAIALRKADARDRGPRCPAAERAGRRDPAGASGAGRPRASREPGHRGDHRDLRRDGLFGRRGARRRGRLQELRGAQHPARAPGAADAGHLLSGGRAGRRAAAAAHPHLARADPHHAGRPAALPRDRPRPHLSARPRHDAHADVPPGRGPA